MGDCIFLDTLCGYSLYKITEINGHTEFQARMNGRTIFTTKRLKNLVVAIIETEYKKK